MSPVYLSLKSSVSSFCELCKYRADVVWVLIGDLDSSCIQRETRWFVVPGIEPSALHILGEGSRSELCPQHR